MKVDKYVAQVGLNVCMAVFVALSAYGIFTYMSWDQGPAQAQSPDALTVFLYATGVAGSIAGICFFGIQMDRRRHEESRNRAPAPKTPKSRS